MIATRMERPGAESPVGWAVGRPPRTVAERRALLDALEDPARWAEAAAALLTDLGFRLLEPDRVGGDDSHLLVALRDVPTQRHFDPESVTYYARSRAGGTAPTTLDRWTVARLGARAPTPALWGHVHVLDRLPVENRFLTFGGDVRVLAIDPALTVVDLWSPAPIVRWGGHSQGTDSLAERIGAFFGRLIVPVDFVPGAAARIDGTLPEVLYRAFLADATAQSERALRRGAVATDLDGWLNAAWTRARADTAATAAARELLAELDV
jgi:hypothetical protein